MPIVRLNLSALLLVASVTAVVAQDSPALMPVEAQVDLSASKIICTLIERAASAQTLPVDFLTRLIWQESTFRADALSPKGAQGIAQFMPATAFLRQLADPYDPEKAIPASAAYLKELSIRFGNLGLAAAAYNAGEQRVSDWMAGNRGLPGETRDYVLTITGRSVEDWAQPNPRPSSGPHPRRPIAPEYCIDTVAHLSQPGATAPLATRMPKGTWAPWGVQIAGNFSLKRAMASYARQQIRYPAILGATAPMVVPSVNGSHGQATFFQIRIPAEDRKMASDICRRLEGAGGACVVLRNAR